MKSGLAEEDEVDFVILSSVKHDLQLPTLKWAEQWFHNYSARCSIRGPGRRREKGAWSPGLNAFETRPPHALAFTSLLSRSFSDRPHAFERLQESEMDAQNARLSTAQRELLKRMKVRMSDPVKTEVSTR